MINEQSELSIQHFSKEFPANWEIEWKANLATCDAADFILKAREHSTNGDLYPFKLSSAMGSQPLSTRYFDLLFHYYGYLKDGCWKEAYVMAQIPEMDIFVPRLKTDLNHGIPLADNIVIREEVKSDLKGRLSAKQLEQFQRDFDNSRSIMTTYIGSIRRERFSFFLTNNTSYRNWCVVADYCKPVSQDFQRQLSQVEIEYKGINGLSPNCQATWEAALEELAGLGNLLIDCFGTDIIIPTNLTKFDWLTKRE